MRRRMEIGAWTSVLNGIGSWGHVVLLDLLFRGHGENTLQHWLSTVRHSRMFVNDLYQ